MTSHPPGATRSFFAALTPDERSRLAAFGEHRRVDDGMVIVAEHAVVDQLYVVVAGHAEVLVREASGAERCIATLGPGDAIGEMSLLTGEPASATSEFFFEIVEIVFEKYGYFVEVTT